MIQCKIFSETSITNNKFQTEINEWLAKYPDIEITHIKTSDSSSQHGSRNKTVYIFYKVKEKVTL